MRDKRICELEFKVTELQTDLHSLKDVKQQLLEYKSHTRAKDQETEDLKHQLQHSWEAQNDLEEKFFQSRQ